MSKFPPTKMVLAYHISSYKTERDGVSINLSTADDAYAHNEAGAVSDTINKLLRHEGLNQSHVISITGEMTGTRDGGSWDFWMFCRNPDAAA